MRMPPRWSPTPLGNAGIPDSVRERVVRAPPRATRSSSSSCSRCSSTRASSTASAIAGRRPPTSTTSPCRPPSRRSSRPGSTCWPRRAGGHRARVGGRRRVRHRRRRGPGAGGLAEQVPEHLLGDRAQAAHPHRAGRLRSTRTAIRFHHVLIREAAYQNLLKRARSELARAIRDWADGVNAERARGGEYEEILGLPPRAGAPLPGRARAARRARPRSRAPGVGAPRRRRQAGDELAATCRLQRTCCAERLPSSTSRPRRASCSSISARRSASWGPSPRPMPSWPRPTPPHSGWPTSGWRPRRGSPSSRPQLYTAAEDWTAHADEAFEAALPTFEAAEDHDSLALAWRLRFGRHGMAMRFGEAAEAAERVIAHARAAKNRRYETRGASGYAQSVLLGPTPVPQAIERCRQLLAGGRIGPPCQRVHSDRARAARGDGQPHRRGAEPLRRGGHPAARARVRGARGVELDRLRADRVPRRRPVGRRAPAARRPRGA